MNKQQEFWAGKFGTEWADTRNSFSSAYTAWEMDSKTKLKGLLESFLGDLGRNITILEVGCNDGFVLKTLDDLGFQFLNGLDINKKAIENAQINLPNSAFRCRRVEDFIAPHGFDLVMTSALLIHIHPNNLIKVMDNIYKNSHRYIFGRELSTVKPIHQGEEIKGVWTDQYFTRRFKDLWLELHPDLKVIKYELIQMQSKPPTDKNTGVQTEVYLLEK